MTGAEVRAVRDAAGLSRAQFAALVGADPSTVCRWESSAAAVRMHPHQASIVALLRRQLDARGGGPDGALASSIREAMVLRGGLRGLYALLRDAFGPSDDGGTDRS